MDEVVPNAAVEPGVSRAERTTMTASQFGCGRHLLSGAGIDVNELLAVPIEDAFADYMPKED